MLVFLCKSNAFRSIASLLALCCDILNSVNVVVQTDVGIVVRPKRYRAVLMDQDMLHRVSAPSAAAGGRPRYSLVWKMAFLPREPGQRCCIARPEWGLPTSIGSAARVDAIKRSQVLKRKAEQLCGSQGFCSRKVLSKGQDESRGI